MAIDSEIKNIYFYFCGKEYWSKSYLPKRRRLVAMGIKRKPKRAKREALLELERQIDSPRGHHE
jgi:hypothetical protein